MDQDDNFIKEVQPGDPVRADTVNALIRAANGSKVELVGGRVSRSRNGTTIDLGGIDGDPNRPEARYEPMDVDVFSLGLERAEVVLSDGVHGVEFKELGEGALRRLGTYYYELARDESARPQNILLVHEDDRQDGQYDYVRAFELCGLDDGRPPYVVKWWHRNLTMGGTGGGLPQGAWRWSPSEAKFTYCNFQFGRAVIELEDQALAEEEKEGGGTLYLNIEHESPSGAYVSKTPLDNSLTQTAIPLVKVNGDMQVVNDYRGMPVIPVWGSPAS